MKPIGKNPNRRITKISLIFSKIFFILVVFTLFFHGGVLAETNPAFTGVQTTGPAPLTVSFIDQSISTETPAGYLWNFGDGSTNSTEQNPNHTYVGSGRYNVSLTVSDTTGAGHTILKPDVIHVQPSRYPGVNFIATPQDGTRAEAILFLDLSELDPAIPFEMYNYIWDFGDGTKDTSNSRSVRHRYQEAGVYEATLQIQDQNGAKHNAPSPVTVTIINSSSTLSAAFTAIPPSGPAPLQVSFIDQSTSPVPITQYLWDFGDGSALSVEKNPVHRYLGVGKYNVTLTITNAEEKNTSTTIPGYIHVQPSEYPDVKFTAIPLDGTAPREVYFVDQSILDPAVPDVMYSYLWDFGDGSPEFATTERNVKHMYTQAGLYSAQLQVRDQDGKKYNAPVPVMLTITNTTEPFIADFTAEPRDGSVPLRVSFSDHSTSPVPITAYTWNFGDNTAISTEKNPVHSFTRPGMYTVSLTITNKNGINTTKTEPGFIQVRASRFPVVQFNATPLSGPAPLMVLFEDHSELDPAIPKDKYRYLWNFGDGSPSDTSGNKTIQHHYERPGRFMAILQILDQNGIPHSAPAPALITVTGEPDPVRAQFSADPVSGQTPLTVYFKDQSITRDRTNKYLWDFGDRSQSSHDKDPIHTYQNPGSYTVSMKISNRLGYDICTKGGYINVTQAITHIINATASSHGIITPSGQISVSGGADQSFSITPDPGYRILDVQVNGQSIGSKSSYTFTHVRRNQSIHADFTTKGIAPVAGFTVDTQSGQTPLTVHFTDTSTGSPDSWYWNFGDESNSVLQNPSHIYGESGQYTVTLTVRNKIGASGIQKVSYIIAL